MKKIMTMVMVSALGGVFTLGAYKLLLENSQENVQKQSTIPQQIFPKNYTTSLGITEVGEFTSAADKALGAVVHVKNKSVYTAYNPIEELFYGKSQGRERVQIGMGSGVIISPDGYIITNNHVIDGATEIEITLNNKKAYQAELIGTDPSNDIALVKVDANDLPHIPFADSDNIKVGEWVLAVGNPYNLTATVTAGIISAKGRDLLGNDQTESYIQTDAVVNSGNSGGALVNTRGELVGINTMITSTTGSYIGYSFAVPSNIAKKVIEDIMEFGNVQKAFIGINYRELNGQNHTDFGVENTEGVIITNVIDGGGAAMAGIRVDDIIVKANNVTISTFADLSGFLKSKRPNDEVRFTVLRNGNEMVVPVTLTENKSTISSSLGLNLKNLSKTEAQRFDVKRGVKIMSILNEDLSDLGLQEGQVIKRINGYDISSTDDAEEALRTAIRQQRVVLEVLDEDGVVERYIFR
ncbi:trypsin-like peptidase domain-containing protein [Urechidicola sp. KH5]